MCDDIPWPELGNVSRGSTQGNQGSKGALGPTDASGCAILQLRAQPGVLTVKLNRQATDWYRIVEREVQGALKLTKTHWRKARRRQDYDARADQDHMELHEWLQQLKDKCISHLELLMQKGDIQDKPYAMPDGIELTLLRMFIERQAAGIPHNPRLRDLPKNEQQQQQQQCQIEAVAEVVGDTTDACGSVKESGACPGNRSSQPSSVSSFQAGQHSPSRDSSASSPSWSELNTDVSSMVARIEVTNQALGRARARAAATRQTVNANYTHYNSTIDIANRAEQDVQCIQEQLNDLKFCPSSSIDDPSVSYASQWHAVPPTPSSATGVVGPSGSQRRSPVSRPGHGPHEHTQGLRRRREHGPQTPETPSIACGLGLSNGYETDAFGLPFYQFHQLQLQQQRHKRHGRGMTSRPQHSGYSSPRGGPSLAQPFVGPLVRSTLSASGCEVSLGLNGTPFIQQPQPGGEIREDSWLSEMCGGEGEF